MSRIGKKVIHLPDGVKIQVQGSKVHVEGPKGKLDHTFHKDISVKVEGKDIHVQRSQNDGKMRALHGLTRALIQNMIEGVAKGYSRALDINGVGFRAVVKGDLLDLTLGFSHEVHYKLPVGVKAKVENNTHIVLESADKALVGQVAKQIRSLRPPEPYQGKGIKLAEETIRRKVGKSATK
jgi:large subunit ribosomal protein L6